MDWRSLLFLVLFSQHLLELCFTLNDEGMALLRIKEMVEKDPYSSLENWGVDGDESDDSSPCSWFGISCENKRVVSLNLEDLRLKGVLSPELGKLVHLRCLDLHNNSFYGNIPLEIHDLQNIKYLDLGYNDFGASFLSDISRFISLDILVLSQKQLLGTFSNQPAGTDISSKIQVNDDILTLDGKSFTRSFGDATIRKLLQGESGIQKSSSKKYMPMLLPKVSAPKVFYMRAIHSSSPPHEQFAPTILPSLDPTVAVDSPMISFKKRSPLLIPLIASGVVLLVIVAFCIIYFRSAKATSVRPWVTGLSGQLQKAFVKGVPQVMFSEIQIACEDFSNIIGSSSSCMIYKGTLSSGVEIAVTSVIPNLSKDWARQSEARFQKKDHIHSVPNTETIGSSNTPYIPELGQQFNSHDEAKYAYMGYAGNIGFNVRMGSTKMYDGEMVGRRILCSKQGYAQSTDTANNENERKHRRIRNSRSGCLAMIYISLDRSIGLWRVVNFIEDHNHPMVTPSKRRYLPVNRVITPLSRALFKSLNTSNISPSDQYSVATQEAGGFDHMQYTPSDLSNMRRDDRCNIIQRDVDLLIELFLEKKTKSSDYYYSFTRHDNGHLSNLFWADPGCRHDYDLFGDSITFDTTYKTNKYNLVLALFCGVNHHKNTIIFAAGFLSRENVESFEWIFNEFLTCMRKHPKTIITDQDPAMKNALLHVFPNTFHRFCLWHITHKMGDKIGHTYQNHSAMAAFHDFLNNSISITSFEESWSAWVLSNGLADNMWLRDIYRIRFQWCPIYMIDHFFAGMKTTQRSEGMNSIVKMKIRSHYTLLEFLSKYEYVLISLREKENSKDHQGQYAPQKTLTPLAIERQMCELYTHEVFIDFQEQAIRSMHYFIRPSHMENQVFDAVSISTFEVSGTIHIGDATRFAKCTCRLFESIGIPCGHIICYLTLNSISTLPEKLICDRWRAIQKNRPTTSTNTADYKDTGNLRPLLNQLISLAGDSEDKLICARKILEDGIKSLTDNQTGSENAKQPRSITRFNDPIQKVIDVGNPEVARTKGCGNGGRPSKKSERFISKRMLNVPKQRSCSKCGIRGHDKRTCPTKDQFSQQE